MSSANTTLRGIISNLGTLTRSCHDVRHCSRCGKPLTDPASWERGIGPICDGKDTAIFAKTIPADLIQASFKALMVDVNTLPAAVGEVWVAAKACLMDQTRTAIGAAHAAGESGGSKLTGEDCRLLAKVIDWMLSFVGVSGANKRALIDVVRCLGFIGLAGVLSGEASTGAASLKFENGLLTLVGSSNKAGFSRMVKIPGVRVPPRGSKKPYTAPAAQHEAFLAAAVEFWPCFEGSAENVKAEALAWLEANPVKQAVAPVASYAIRGAGPFRFTLSFQWDKAKSPAIVEKLKSVPSRERSYDPATRSWSFDKRHLPFVQGLFA